MDSYKIIKYPLATEKAVKLIESENKIIFVVHKKATKKQIKEAVEKEYKVKIVKINTLISPKGKKKAYLTLSNETPAIDVATKLELM